ncbi:MAG: recombinase family protein [Lachnospiraceae bacterium]|nr:recombinase family protein [Lachnospiraceae bacterium]
MSQKENAVVYARYSSHNQQDQSIEGQIAAAQKYAEARGYNIIGEYCDRAKTGTNDNREEFQRMLSDTVKKQFTVIIVWKVDRFGRNREEIMYNKYRAKKNGVRVEYVAENIGNGPEGVILESLFEGMAEYFSLQLSQNVKRGLYESAKKHLVLNGSVALGYMPGPDKTYQINPDEAPVVKRIFEMYASGHTESTIVNYLNEKGYRTRKGTPFGKSSLNSLLQNEKYIGTYIFKDLIHDEDVIPPIVDKDLFAQVQRMLKMNKRMPAHSWSYSDYLLTGKMYCGECGAAMVGKAGTSQTGKKHCYYACSNHLKKRCVKSSVRQDWAEKIVLSCVSDLLHDPELFDTIVERTWDYYERQDSVKGEIAVIEKQIAEIDKKIQNLTRAIESLTDASPITGRINELSQQKDELLAALVQKNIEAGISFTKEHIVYFLQKCRDMDADDADVRKKLIETFINSVYIYEDRIMIAFNYSGDRNTLTLEEIKKAATCEEFASDHLSRGDRSTCELICLKWIKNVFIAEYRI